MSETRRSDDKWQIVQRLLEYEGELRAGAIRTCVVLVLYSVQLLHFFVFSERTAAEQTFHRQVSYLTAIWLVVSLIALVSIARFSLPGWLKYLTTCLDLVLLTVASHLGNGPTSPVVLGYWIVLAIASLRGSLPLVWFSTVSSMACYLLLVGSRDSAWFDADHSTPPVNQLVTLVALAATGITLGQLLRMHRLVISELQSRRDKEPSV